MSRYAKMQGTDRLTRLELRGLRCLLVYANNHFSNVSGVALYPNPQRLSDIGWKGYGTAADVRLMHRAAEKLARLLEQEIDP
jgi:hypothetical protein